MDEVATKLARVRSLLQAEGCDAILLGRSSNFAWLTGGGASYINLATDGGVAQVLITADKHYVLTDNIEAERLAHEEAVGTNGWEVISRPWFAASKRLDELTASLRMAIDGPHPTWHDVGGAVARLRWDLLPVEVERFRALGRDAGAAIATAARSLSPGMTETEVAGRLAAETYGRNAVPIVTLVAADDRLQRFRHPLPQAVPIQRHVMLVLCARRAGLVASVTRFVHFGPMPRQIAEHARAAAAIDAAVIAATSAGHSVREAWDALTAAYAQHGFPEGWHLHHQGGLAGYEPREYVATPGFDAPIQANQVFAWNPSVPGAKSEDSVLITDNGFEVLTTSPHWPLLTFEINGQTIARPAVLEI